VKLFELLVLNFLLLQQELDVVLEYCLEVLRDDALRLEWQILLEVVVCG
jgi:hypothetical protein